jgi:hypothetical protein
LVAAVRVDVLDGRIVQEPLKPIEAEDGVEDSASERILLTRFEE